jgi:hypothetical protein
MLAKEFWGLNEFFMILSWLILKNSRLEYLIPHLQLVYPAMFFSLLNLGRREMLPGWFF